MTAQDPSEFRPDDDRTQSIPTPGGRRGATLSAAPNAAPTSAPPAPPWSTAAALSHVHGYGVNPLVRAANPLLDLILPLRSMVSTPNLEGLRQQLVDAIKTFEANAKATGLGVEAIAAARYALCTFVDETISRTPWGGGAWASRSLLVAFHNEAWGGEKFFLILQRLTQDIPRNIDVLELMYLCLVLGMEGRYGAMERGYEQLAALRERLQQLIQAQRGPYEQELSPRWRGLTVKKKSVLRIVPLWVLAAVAGVILLVAQLAFSHLLSRQSDPVFAALMGTRFAAPMPPPVPPSTVAVAPAPVRVAGFLAPEIAQGLVSVSERADRSIVTLRGDGIFGSGSAEVARQFEPLVNRIGDALNTVPGKVVVIGHTDNTPPSLSARLPSNWELSKARAASVVKLLAERAAPSTRYSIEGRADTEPVVSNSSPVNRARNRRVDIVVLTPALAP